MSFIVFVQFLFVIFSFFLFGSYFHEKGDTFVIGSLIGTCFAIFILGFLYFDFWLYKCKWSKLPKCKKGLCQRKNYTYLGRYGLGYIYKCKCGDQYLEWRNEFCLFNDEIVQHYMKREKHFFLVCDWFPMTESDIKDGSFLRGGYKSMSKNSGHDGL